MVLFRHELRFGSGSFTWLRQTWAQATSWSGHQLAPLACDVAVAALDGGWGGAVVRILEWAAVGGSPSV